MAFPSFPFHASQLTAARASKPAKQDNEIAAADESAL